MIISGETILITGASSGIGKALAIMLAANNIVIACGRNLGALTSLAAENKNIKVLSLDVSDEKQIEIVKQRLSGLCNKLDRVVLNAGHCEYLQPTQFDWSIFKKMMDVNFYGWLHTLQICMEPLEKAHKPHIVGIASQVIHAPFSKAEAYGASKAAASYFLKSLALDLKWRHMDISLINPGFVDTPLTRANDFPMPFLMSTDAAAKEITYAMERRLYEYNFPKKLSLLLALSKIIPKYWFKKMRYYPANDE